MDEHTTTVYVGNLPWRATEEDLLALFRQYGPIVDARIIQDPVTGRSRGYGFVEFEDPDSVQEAVMSLQGKELLGRPMTVTEARPKPTREA